MATDTLVNYMIDEMAKWAIGQISTANLLTLCLYVNNHTLVVGDTIASLTECTAPGYVEQALTSGSWTGSTTGGLATYTYPPVSFNLTGPGSPGQTIYGHFYRQGSGGALLWGQTWSSPYVIPSGGAVIQITPTWNDEQCP